MKTVILVMLTFYSPQNDPIEVGTYDTLQDCEEVAYFIQQSFKDSESYFTCDLINWQASPSDEESDQ